MAGRLIFTLTPERRDHLGSWPGGKAFTPRNIIGMLKYLQDGGPGRAAILALTPSVVTGYRVPEGTEIEFDEEVPEDHPLRAQASARVSRVGDKRTDDTVPYADFDLSAIGSGIWSPTGHIRLSRPNGESAPDCIEELWLDDVTRKTEWRPVNVVTRDPDADEGVANAIPVFVPRATDERLRELEGLVQRLQADLALVTGIANMKENT